MNFTDLSLIPPLLRAVSEAGYEKPSPIQQKAIPPVLAGRDLLGCAQTGTGKTAAFALPILQLLAARRTTGPRVIRTLVLTPTRELALQIQESFETYGKHLPLRSTVIFGGVGQAPQVAQLRRGVDILVATPGRLNDLINQGFVKLGDLEIFVLDEADRMLDMGFVQDVKRVVQHIPEKRQTLLFSATMPNEIVQLANSLLHKPTKVFVTPPATTVEKIEQSLYKVDKANKRRLLAELLKDKSITSALVFTRTKHGADRVVRELKRDGIAAMAIHGNKSQGARQDALARFKDGRTRVLVATDIAARGLDINELSHVVNYDLPNIPETYVHRIGRTGRAGNEGIAISFCCVDELPYLDDIQKLTGITIPEVKNHPWPMQVLEPTAPAPKGRQAPAKKTRPEPAQKPARQPAPKKPQKSSPPAPEKKQPAAGLPQPVVKSTPRQDPAEAVLSHSSAAPQKKANTGGRKPRGGRPPENPYENLTGGRAIVTRRPVWSTGPEAPRPAETEGEDDMSRSNNRRRRSKKGGAQNSPQQGGGQAAQSEQPKKKLPEIKKDANGLFDFSEEELAQDDSIRLIGSNNSDTKYASFEDYLKDH